MRNLVLATLMALGLLALLSGTSATPHQSDKIHWEAMLFSQIVEATAAGGVGPGQQGRHQDNCGAFGEAGQGVFDKDVSCDDPIAPDDEIAVAVHPTNPNIILGGPRPATLPTTGASVATRPRSGSRTRRGRSRCSTRSTSRCSRSSCSQLDSVPAPAGLISGQGR
jgi:hypothetical protein